MIVKVKTGKGDEKREFDVSFSEGPNIDVAIGQYGKPVVHALYCAGLREAIRQEVYRLMRTDADDAAINAQMAKWRPNRVYRPSKTVAKLAAALALLPPDEQDRTARIAEQIRRERAAKEAAIADPEIES